MPLNSKDFRNSDPLIGMLALQLYTGMEPALRYGHTEIFPISP